MRLTIRILGTEVLHIATNSDSTSPEPEPAGDCTTYPIGFTSTPGDQRWVEHPAPDLE